MIFINNVIVMLLNTIVCYLVTSATKLLIKIQPPLHGGQKTMRPPLSYARPLSRLGRAQTRLALLSLNRCFNSRLIRISLKLLCKDTK